MKDEMIKLLDKLKDDDFYIVKDLTGTSYIELSCDEVSLLLNYFIDLNKELIFLKELLLMFLRSDK